MEKVQVLQGTCTFTIHTESALCLIRSMLELPFSPVPPPVVAATERPLDLPGIMRAIADHSARPRYTFMVLDLIARAAGRGGAAGPYVRDGEQLVPIREWLSAAIAPTAARYRKSGTKCVRADESAVDLTPMGCAGQKVCRDASGTLACTNCRTLQNGCPDFEETRIYAAVNDPAIKKTAGGGGGGGGNLARLRQCCTALGAEAKRLGSSPEAGMIATAATQCTALVNAAGPSGNAPELGAIRAALAGRNVPAICAGF